MLCNLQLRSEGLPDAVLGGVVAIRERSNGSRGSAARRPPGAARETTVSVGFRACEINALGYGLVLEQMTGTGGDETCHRRGDTGEAGVLFNMERRRKVRRAAALQF